MAGTAHGTAPGGGGGGAGGGACAGRAEREPPMGGGVSPLPALSVSMATLNSGAWLRGMTSPMQADAQPGLKDAANPARGFPGSGVGKMDYMVQQGQPNQRAPVKRLRGR